MGKERERDFIRRRQNGEERGHRQRKRKNAERGVARFSQRGKMAGKVGETANSESGNFPPDRG